MKYLPAANESFETEAPEHSLYGGAFFSHGDKAQMEILHQLTPEQLSVHPFTFQDDRLTPMLFLFRARNYPWTLTSEEQTKWTHKCVKIQ